MARLTGIVGKSIVGAALALGMATPALADQGPLLAYANPPGLPAGSDASATFTVPVTATIASSCRFADNKAPTGTYDAGPIDTSDWIHDFPMTVQCTGPSRLAIVSTNGGLKSAATITTGYTNLAPYTVKAYVAQNAGGAAEADCPAANLKTDSAATCTLRGTAAPGVGMLFTPSFVPNVPDQSSFIRVSAPAYAGSDILVASPVYLDTLTVTVSPDA